jgi:hypothetical protein
VKMPLSLRALGPMALMLGLGSPALAGNSSLSSHLVYTAVTPCRVVDTAGGRFAAGQTRSYVVHGPTTDYSSQGGNADGCGVPDLSAGDPRRNLARAVVLNVVAVSPSGPGNLRVWPSNLSAPLASAINYVELASLGVANNNVANEVIIPLCTEEAAVSCGGGDISIRAEASGVHVVADVVGYFTDLDAGSILARGNIYQREASLAVGAGLTMSVSASCDDNRDFPLDGSCAVGGLLLRLDGRAADWSGPGAASYECSFLNTGVLPVVGTARIICLNVP